MNKKLKKLSIRTFILAVVQFVIAYIFYHYMSPDGTLSNVFSDDPGKPFVSLLFGVFGVLFLFAGSMSRLIARIFYPKKG